jgi:hypothetical protein
MKVRDLAWPLVALLVGGAWAPAAAQQGSDGWDVVVAPYLMGASMEGVTSLRGIEVDVDASASDIFSNLQFGAMGLVEAKKGSWGFGADAIWMALGTTVRDINVDVNQGAFAFYGIRRLGAAADVNVGVRVNTLQGEFDFKQVGLRVAQDRTWVDPIVGLTLRTPAERRFQLRLYSEIGGFGVGSDFTWQFFPTIGIRLTRASALEFGYRWLDVDYESGSEANEPFAYDVLTQGPVLGVAFKF